MTEWLGDVLRDYAGVPKGLDTIKELTVVCDDNARSRDIESCLHSERTLQGLNVGITC